MYQEILEVQEEALSAGLVDWTWAIWQWVHTSYIFFIIWKVISFVNGGRHKIYDNFKCVYLSF